jgi:hypothetical protein
MLDGEHAKLCRGPQGNCPHHLCLALRAPARIRQVISLGGAENVTVLGATTVTNTGGTIIYGNLALTPGTSVTGFPPGQVINGSIHINNAIANEAHAGALAAYNQIAGETPTMNLTGMNLSGMTLSPGIYRFDTFARGWGGEGGLGKRGGGGGKRKRKSLWGIIWGGGGFFLFFFFWGGGGLDEDIE